MMKHYFNTNKVLSITALAIGAITIFFACKKDDAKTGGDETKDNATIFAATSESTVNAIYEDVFSSALDYNSRELPPGGRKAPVQADVQVCYGDVEMVPGDLTSFPKTVTIDFGAGCTDGNGITRKGKIKIALKKLFWFLNSDATVTFENYHVNGIKVEGTVTIRTEAFGTGKDKYHYTVANGKVTFPTGYTATYSGTRTITQIEGGSTPALRDDKYEMTGNAVLTDSLGVSTVTITSPLQRQVICHWIQAGEITVTLNAHSGKLNYGTGACDNKALLTIGDKTKEIILKH